MYSILITEDDTALRTGLEFELSEEGYRVYTACNAAEAVRSFDNVIDLAVLDVNLPDMDGFTLCSRIKKLKNIPVIFLTCRDLEEDELRGFDCGADDYITKPFSVPLLRKRIAAVLGRYNAKSSEYTDGFLTVNFDKLSARAGDKELSFTPTEYKLLKVFITNGSNVLTRRMLLEKLWDNEGNFVDEHALTVNINRIRTKIEQSGHKYIKTVYGIGYSWIGEMTC
ncbi:MAG: response regulator transcription factor [Oscillospiraceae bacterium]|nr:response regulator transcription factor [Oscillospiraceae bacterium]